MKRREFLRTSCAASLAALGTGAAAYGQPASQRQPGESEAAYRQRLVRERAAQQARESRSPIPKRPGESEVFYRQRLARERAAAAARRRASGREYYELRRYEIESEDQKAGFDAFMGATAIPALNRLGIAPVGVFYPWEELSPIYVLIPHDSASSVAALRQRLERDPTFMEKGAAFLDAPAEKPAYKRMTSSLMVAFEGMPHLERPIWSPGRVLQLRTYESPSVKTGQKKIEMFNTAEIDIFRKTGLNPVFFGETLAGEKMPNLTYMLVFNDMDERKANWKQFVSSPEWKKLSSIPEYADKKILCGITNLFLKPAEYSQI
jgi:NIPSNAP